MLLQHSHHAPVGTVIFDKPTKAGVGFTAHIPKITEPGILKDRTDEAFQSVKAKILRHVSIGFRPLKQPIPNEDGGYDYPEVELYELSLVSVPAQPDAEILEVRRASAKGRSPVVRIGQPQRSPVVKLNPTALARLNGTLKINAKPKWRLGDPIKITKTGTPVVKLDPAACSWLQKSGPSPVVKLSKEDIERGKRRASTVVVKLGRP
jgi:HK97 family phage prohead protease